MGSGGVMGNRSFIQVESKDFLAPILFYGHWSGEENQEAVRNVLDRTGRIGDPSYLAAQIFHQFAITLGAYDGELGFGIASGEVGDAWTDSPTIYVDADTGVYTYGGVTYSEFAKRPSMA
jgi:hypothetical protein